MEEITIGQIIATITVIVGFITGVSYLIVHLKKWITILLSDQFKLLDEKIDTLHTKIDTVDMETCKNYLVTFLSNVEKGKQIDEIERERFWEQYAHYQAIGGNSYVQRKVEQFIKEDKL